ncbi:hypothetical protein LTR10_011776 [Elasticomyces elasticus]|uniref:Arrestin-like N-terminal domain-containing protein n=1 Tax=Exophiala sideris TaxID=1016849 RepID=A0ABR0JEA1_9EURO|nr:hypothetical protein LTR10_011776 [Elasticomyces elasticus]KAK5031767.1 hypothetical protein LTS07_004387 [Exophiala sideris]KAK5040696.1 hypothetical protein LTR13_002996 [Exophiala sideris]KAK5061970.1 hypothetical protein LTR69_005154 [Exophiala sideris]KAK5184670.1 hypothetical protein LTR44_003345 [Eurotiomycetes sp. CCFEE 6388]
MSFKIHLDGPAKTVYPLGAWISGRVEVSDPSARHPLAIHFSGRSKVHISERERENDIGEPGSHTDYQWFDSKALMFRHSFNLQQSPDGSYPFQVQIPEWTEQVPESLLREHGADVFPEEAPWQPTLGPNRCPIPDTFYHCESPDFQIDLETSVSYKLQAEMRKDDGKFHFRSKKDEDIEIVVKNVRPYQNDFKRPDFDNRTYEASVQTLRLLPEHVDGHLSFRDKTHSLFHKSTLPTASFRLGFSVPDTLYLGRSPSELLPLSFSISRIPAVVNAEHLSKSTYRDDQIPTPRVYLKRFAVRLTSATRARMAKPISWYRDVHDTTATYTLDLYDEKMKHVPGKERLELPVNGSWCDLGRELGISMAQILEHKHTRDMDLVPNFSCQNIVRMYTVDWRVELDICGEELEWYVKSDEGTGMPIRILAGDGTHVPQQPQQWTE